MKRILFALTLVFGAGAASSVWACDCEHKKSEKSCGKGGDCKNCTGSCNPNNQKQETPPKNDKESKKS